MRRIATTAAVLASLVAPAAARASADSPSATAPPPPAGAPSDFFGLVSEDAFASPGDYRQQQLTTQASLGIRLLRETFNWSQIEVGRGRYDLSYYDGFVGDAARAGISVLPILFRAPRFRGGKPGTIAYPPKRYADLGGFGAVLVRRYGPDGTFWSENPGIPKLPIRSWQIWNEPNLKAYWARKPNAKQYAKLLAAAAKGIKAVDPGAEIVTAGMPESRIGVPLKRFIPALYRAGAKRAFDVLAINPYGHTAAAVIKNLARTRRIMRRFRDDAPIWATEVGWSDSGPRAPQRVGGQGQATQLAALIGLLLRDRAALNIRGVVYFQWRDAAPYSGKDFWGLHTGLLTQDGQPKAAYYALQQAIAASG